MPCENSGKAQCRPETEPRPNLDRPQFCCPPLLLNNNGVQALGVLDVDGLHVAVELLLGALLVVTPPGDADAEPVRDALDTLLPDLLVQLGIQTDVRGALDLPLSASILSTICPSTMSKPKQLRLAARGRRVGVCGETYHGLGSERLDLLDRTRSPLLEGDTVELPTESAFRHASQSVSASRTRLCMWMVYSRATTSAMAERVAFPWGLVDDILAAAR
jgi:hypothetical protein